jgi:TPR repeat protein
VKETSTLHDRYTLTLQKMGAVNFMFSLAKMERELGQRQQAIYWYTRAAKAGHQRAQVALDNFERPITQP